MSSTVLLFLSLIASQTYAAFPGWKAEPFPLSKVQLDPSSRYGEVQAQELTYLLTLDSTRLVCLYLLAANISKTCNPYPHTHYYGHFIGHWLSSSAMMYSNTGNKTLQTKMNGIISSLAQCEQAWKSIGFPGYLFTYSPNEFMILEGQLVGPIPVAVPFYVMHKVMAGLIDQYIHANSTAALDLVTKMGDWVTGNVNQTLQRIGQNGWQNVLNTEWGGMNEAMYNLYGITGNKDYLITGNYFDHYSFSRPLANNIDDLTGLHANTHIPEISGSARGYEVNGNETQRDIAVNFFNILNTTRTFATGGSNDGEHWGSPYRLGDQMNADTEESCTQYNILKVARYMYTWSGSSLVMDYYERAITNGLIGNLNLDTPQYFYMNPLGGGGLKKPWGDAYNGFYCCWGTLSESFGKLSDSIYFHTTNSNSKQTEVIVNQYVASTLNWAESGISMTQTTKYPINSDGSTTSIKIDASNGNFILSLRVPWWTNINGGAYVKINGKAIDNSLIIPSSYLRLGLNDNISFKTGDIIDVKFPMKARWEKINDNRSDWQNVGVFMYGPILLAGMTDSVYFEMDINKIATSLYPIGDGSNKFIAIDSSGNNMTMIPQMDIINEIYTIYFKNSHASVLPYNTSGSKVEISGAYDMTFTGGAGIIANPLESIRSGNPGGKTTGTAMTFISNAQHKIKNVGFDYQYVSGYGGNNVGTGANFTLYLITDPTSSLMYTIYQSPHFRNYSYDQCNTCYSPPVKTISKDVNIDVSNKDFVFEFVFQNNDRNVQLLLDTLNITVFWT